MCGYDASRLIWTGEQITIRPLCPSDYHNFVTGFQESLPSKNRFDDGQFDTGYMTPEWYQGLLAKRAQEAAADYSYMLHIFRNGDRKPLGYCDITPHRREEFQYARIGYTILNNFWGNGYGTQCVGGLVRLGFEVLNLHRLEAHVDPENPASKRVLRKAGFQFECVRKGFILEDDGWADREIYYINNGHWTETGGVPPC